MDDQRFDAALRALQAGTTRRAGLAGMLGVLLGGVGAGLDAAAKGRGRDQDMRGATARRGSRSDPGTAGPCGDGTAQANRCSRNSDCCTKYCAAGICRCRPNWMDCTKAEQCCSGRCLGGRCDGGCKPEGSKCEQQFNCCSGMICKNRVCTVSPRAKCTKSNCRGCCDGTTCRNGADRTACGVKGGVCVTCGPGQTCRAGVCVSSLTCGPATCPDGCCLNGVCTPSTSATCGVGGAACASCSATQGCNAGACVNCTVCDSGCPYTTVGDAVAAAADGTIIRVGGGPRTDLSTVNIVDKNLTIEACDPNDIPELVGADWWYEVTQGTASVTLRNLDLSQPDSTYLLKAQGAGLNLSLESVRIHGGAANYPAAKIFSDAAVTFLDCILEDNSWPFSGAALYVKGNATVVIDGDSVIRNNSVTKPCDPANDSYGVGGAIAVDGGTLTLKGNTQVTDNSAACAGGGVVVFDGTLNLQGNAVITGNTADCYGGLLVNDNYNASVSGVVNGATAANISGNTGTGGSCSCDNYSLDNGTTCPNS